MTQHFETQGLLMLPFDSIDAAQVKNDYTIRHRISADLLSLHNRKIHAKYSALALGVTDEAGNYSAAEHRLGPKILSNTSTKEIWKFAADLLKCKTPQEVVDAIYTAAIQNIKISIGSEMAMMLMPDTFWVGNTRTIWTHLLIKHSGNRSRANLELSLYRDNERHSGNGLWNMAETCFNEWES
ncbi:MAG: hypothetical protein U1F87_04945 [Kiritimatiellia bacterium]